jgi:predicted lipoprotein
VKIHRLAAAALSVPLLLTACSGGGGTKRTDALEALADDHLVPAYADLASSMAALQAAVEALCVSPGDGALTTARDALAGARGAWKRTEATRIGPDMARRSAEKIDWPIDAERIDELLDSSTPSPLTAEVVGTQMSSALRGLGALEHVLFAADALTAVQVPRTCEYSVAAATVAATEAAAIEAAWTTASGDEPAYRDAFAGVGDSKTADMALDDLVNESLNLTERMTDLELRAVRGDGPDAPPPDPIDTDLLLSIHEGPAGLGVADALDRLAGLRTVYVDGLGPLLGTDLLARVRGELDAATAAFEALGDTSLRDAATLQTAQVRLAFDAVKGLQTTIATEVVAGLGVTVGFSDADGDAAG